jgi:hypothetical protein
MKSRGTAHSNQVRELFLSDAGVTLTDAYSAGGEVLMGTMRWEKELAERRAHEVTEVAGKLKRVLHEAEEAELEVRVKSLQVELSAKQVEKALRPEPPRATRASCRRVVAGCASCAAPTRLSCTGNDRSMRRLRFKFRLYVAGDAQNSAQALTNLHAICRKYLPDRHDIEVVDVFLEPLRALEEGIFMTPALVKLTPLPKRTAVGTLSQTTPVLHALGLDDLAT